MRLWPQATATATATDPGTLVSRIARGDREALDLIYRAEAAPVYRFALAMCGNPAWSADATHDAFIHLAEHPAGYDAARGPLRAWLCGIARHKLLARWRDPGDAAFDEESDVDATDTSPESQLVRVQDSDSLWSAVRALPWPFREAVVLVDLQERPYAEAAQIAGVELNTLRTRVHRGRQRLARALAPLYGEIDHD
ncbi:MAG TPA: RNA polymerase sigma factor [Ramlibacter sp.]|uniref:RNA polymerase sigma factor n=1 Tax=Ramlibacter sp. TaxID=1917967 RepID=UPI002CF27856|nr:RNA polymerase sigma factor [Ramlibacter sp.]HVZ46986.1 RNA polymerase sigma factor [Ramlibacter sp.]